MYFLLVEGRNYFADLFIINLLISNVTKFSIVDHTVKLN